MDLNKANPIRKVLRRAVKPGSEQMSNKPIRKTSAKDFSERLNALLDNAGFYPKNKGRQIQLAKIVDVTDKAAWKWLNGEAMPRTPTLAKILEEFPNQPTTVEWMITGNEEFTPEWVKSKINVNNEGIYVESPIESREPSTKLKSFDDNNNRNEMTPAFIARVFGMRSFNQYAALEKILTMHESEYPEEQIEKIKKDLYLYLEEKKVEADLKLRRRASDNQQSQAR